MLTHSRLKEILNYNPETGVFTWKVRLAPRGPVGAIAGAYSAAGRGRLEIRIGGKLYLGHRLAWFYVYGDMPSGMLDHVDGNPSNNRIDNLRQATIQQNNQNRAKRDGLTSEWKGVSWSTQYGKWMVQVTKDRKHVHRSVHDDERDAAETYIFASLDHFGEYGRYC